MPALQPRDTLPDVANLYTFTAGKKHEQTQGFFVLYDHLTVGLPQSIVNLLYTSEV
jgi:hypothetical protein